MLCLNDLSITPNWRVRRIEFLDQIDSLPGNIFIGCGDSVNEGVLDPQDTSYKSAAELLFQRKELAFNHLLLGLNENYQSGLKPQIQQLELTICIKNINWDALCCYVLCDHLVRTGEFPSWAYELVKSANAVNQGEAILDDRGSTPFALFYALTMQEQDFDLQAAFAKGRALVVDIAQTTSDGLHAPNVFLTPVRNKDRYSQLIEISQLDYENFLNDYHSGHKFEMSLPCSEDGNTDETKIAKVLFLENVPQSRLFLYWGWTYCDLLVYQKQETNSEVIHWSFSIPPKSGFSLRGLGYFLEKKEASIRTDRKGSSRWNDYNYSDNADPWYDGRNHQYCLVESPRSGTKINSTAMKDMLLTKWQPTSEWRFNDLTEPVHLTYFFFAVRNGGIEDFSGWKEEEPFLGADNASKILGDTSLLVYKSASSCCVFYTSKVNHNVLIEVTVLIEEHIAILEQIPELITKAKQTALRQCQSGLEQFPESYFKDLHARHSSVAKLGESGFLHLSVVNADLKKYPEERIEDIVKRISSANIKSDTINVLSDGQKSTDILDLSSCISFLFAEEEQQVSSIRHTKKLLILYSLFIKTSYQQFSQRLKPIPDFEREGEALSEVLVVQREFSRFLTNYDFVATELSFDPKTVFFAEEVFRAIHLKDHKDETNEEMRFLSDLANTYANESQKKRNKIVQHFIVGLAAFAMCDFFYSFAQDLFPNPGSDSHPYVWGKRFILTIVLPSVFVSLYYFLWGRKHDSDPDS